MASVAADDHYEQPVPRWGIVNLLKYPLREASSTSIYKTVNTIRYIIQGIQC